MMREDLAAMGQRLEDNDFYAIIMGFLPGSYDPYISAVNSTSSVLGTTLSADDLILTVTEEYKCSTLKAKGGKKDNNAAFYSNDAEKGQKGGSNSKRKGDCHNCGKKGHWIRDCWEEGGGKEGQGPKQKGKGKGKAKGKGKDKEKEMVASTEEKTLKKEDKPKDEEAWMTMALENKCTTSHVQLCITILMTYVLIYTMRRRTLVLLMRHLPVPHLILTSA